MWDLRYGIGDMGSGITELLISENSHPYLISHIPEPRIGCLMEKQNGSPTLVELPM
jgi:hypothetical protein